MPEGSWKREGQAEMMVSHDSARLWYPREERVASNADHSQMAKLKRGESGIYPSVRWAIKQALLSAADLYNGGKQQGENGTSHDASEDEPPLRPGILDDSHHESSISLETRVAGLVAGQPMSQSEDATNQHENQPSTLDTSQHDRRDVEQTISHWQRGTDDCVNNDMNSKPSPSISDMTFSTLGIREEGKENESTTSHSTEVCVPSPILLYRATLIVKGRIHLHLLDCVSQLEIILDRIQTLLPNE